MVLDIIGHGVLKCDGDVQVDYSTGKTILYTSETIERLTINPDSITTIIVNKKS